MADPPAKTPAPVADAAHIADPAISRPITAADIEAAVYVTGDLPPGQSAITAKVQILLDRAGISPGVVDGWRGGMSQSAIMAFQRRSGLPVDGVMSPVLWQLLRPFAAAPLTMDYTITLADAEGLVDHIPTDYREKAQMSSQGFTSVAEKLAERFHMDEKFLRKLNPDSGFAPGETIRATVPAKPIRAAVTRIIVDKQTRRVAAYDANFRLVADYPATVGSAATPSPQGRHMVDAVALNPTYTYNPQTNFRQGDNDRVLIVPPGPNGPVGNVWIDLSQPTYGIHGTATPSRLFVNQSNGCVRLTNWDALELAHMVQPGVTEVEFLAPGETIAGAIALEQSTNAAARVAVSISAARPPARPADMAAQVTAAADEKAAQDLPLSPLHPPRKPVAARVTPEPVAPEPATPPVVTPTEAPPPDAGAGAGQPMPQPLPPGVEANGEGVLPLPLPVPITPVPGGR